MGKLADRHLLCLRVMAEQRKKDTGEEV